MYRTVVTLYSTAVLGASWYGIENPSYYVGILLKESPNFLLARIFIVLSLLAYVYIAGLSCNTVRNLLAIAGFVIFGLALVTFFSPTFFGHFSFYVPIGDVFIAIEGGILAMIVSAEIPSYKTHFFKTQLARFRVMSTSIRTMLSANRSAKVTHKRATTA